VSSTKFIFVTGGVLSGLGKGIACSSVGLLLQPQGFRVSFLKLDPYLNVDPGTMSPFQHGEVFVTDDGAETDLDLGNYERFSGVTMTRANNSTSGRIYQIVIERERRGDYLGKTVQVIPHVTNEIKKTILGAVGSAEFLIVEVGGTVGDIESLPFLEAIRQISQENRGNCVFVHLTLVPYLSSSGELKTKPTQHSVRELREIGLQPDILLCRVDRALPQEIKDKIALFCNLPAEAVIAAPNVKNIYEVPLRFHEEGLGEIILRRLGLLYRGENLAPWYNLVETMANFSQTVTIGIVGKYVELGDSYKSLAEALLHGGLPHNIGVNLEWIESEDLNPNNLGSKLSHLDGILVPGGFGSRGIAGKIRAIEYARTQQIPFFGICLGFQCAVIEYARNVCGLDADSAEFNPNSPSRVIYKLRELRGVDDLGGNMRLGAYDCELEVGSLAMQIYGEQKISERHRHRYEFNREFEEVLTKAGLIISGQSPDRDFIEIIELSREVHPWFLGCQFHPEFKSRPLAPHPVFVSFIQATIDYKNIPF